MDKITFKDYPDTTTPVSADNLNQVQTNVENAINGVSGQIPEIVNEKTTSTAKAYCTTYINNNFETKGTILWSNSNPSNSFVSQNINLNSNDYDVLEIFYKVSITGTKIWSEKFLKGYGTQLINVINLNEDVSQTTGARSRDIDYVSDTSLLIKNGLIRDDGTQASTPTVNNNILIPLYIIGYKTGLFE